MILYIDTASNTDIYLALKKGENALFELREPAERAQSEKLLPLIDKILKNSKLKLSDLTAIEVNSNGGSFTSLRIGVVTANALAYGLGVPVVGVNKKDVLKKAGISIVEPKYSASPQITIKKPRL